MKYIIAGILLGLLVVVVLFNAEKKGKAQNITQAQNGRFQTTTIEGCQYFMCRSDLYSHIVLSHKGNCTNHVGIQK